LGLIISAANLGFCRWHSKDDADPLWDPKALDKKAAKTYNDRLKACKMVIQNFNSDEFNSDTTAPTNPPWWKDASAFLSGGGNTVTTLCHAAMYGVNYGPDLPLNIKARDASPPARDPLFAVGTSDLDALIAFFGTKAANSEDADLVKDLNRLVHILGENGDGDLDGIQKFSDEVQSHSFKRVDGGATFSWQTQTQPGNAPREPSDADNRVLDELNQTQKMVETLAREEEDVRWQIFATWWTWISSTAVKEKESFYKPKLAALINRLGAIGSDDDGGIITKTLKDKIKRLLVEDQHTRSTADRYYQRRDPTLLFTKIGSGWEADFSDPVQVRLRRQTVTVSDKGAVDAATRLGGLATKTPRGAQDGVKALLEEFIATNPNPQIGGGSRMPVNNNNNNSQVMPYFSLTNRDKWNDTQPWRPLFLEWEVLYYEIPFDKWRCSNVEKKNKYGASAVEYVVDDDISQLFAPGKSRNVLRIAGRNYLQPQAGSTFGNLIGPVFDNTSEDVLSSWGVTKDMRQKLLDIVKDAEFVSAPMSALTESLLTIRGGSHLTPLVALPQSKPIALPDATSLFASICPPGKKAIDVLQMIGSSSGPTPYASSVVLDPAYYPLRPVQHGQFQFIKLNVIDKFGQALTLIDPRPPRDGQFFTALPIISDSLRPGMMADPQGSRPNIPLRQKDRNTNPFVTLPPAINQPSRLHAVFVSQQQNIIPGGGGGGGWEWRRCSNWENPVWGWVVVNYADSGIQFFFGDGRFYREIRFGTQSGTSTSHKFLPFEPPRDPITKQIITGRKSQLDHLIEQLSDEKYLLAFWDTINTSFDSSAFQHAPASFSTFSSAIVGKPLALVNAGWALELAEKPKVNWTTSDATSPALRPERTLLRPAAGENEPWAGRQWVSRSEDAKKSGFQFPIKIGDASRRFDGLVAYFGPSPTNTPSRNNSSGTGSGTTTTTVSSGSTNTLDLTRFFTFPEFIATPQPQDPRVAISEENYPVHTPYWFSPLSQNETLARHDDKLQVLGLLMDPFLPVHAFSGGVLPTKALSLPRWATEQAMKRMTAFWHAGPLVVTRDVDPVFSEHRLLNDDYIDALAKLASGIPLEEVEPVKDNSSGGGGDTKGDSKKEPLPAVQFPLAPPVAAANGADARFMYLQPYRVPVDKTKPSGDKETRYNPYRIDGAAAAGQDAKEAALPAGPYTALEGYLQIAKDIKAS